MRVGTPWEGDDAKNYKRKNSKWYKVVDGEDVEVFTPEKMSKKERVKLNDLNKTLYSGKMDMLDLETWRNRDEKTIVANILSSNLYPGAIAKVNPWGEKVDVELPNGKKFTVDPDSNDPKLGIDQFQKLKDFYKNNDKDPDLLSHLQFQNLDELQRTWGKLGYKIESNKPSLGGVLYSGVIKDKNGRELAEGDMSELRKYFYNNATNKDLKRLKELSIKEAQDNINKINIKKINLNTSKVHNEAKESYLDKTFKNQVMATLSNSPLSQLTKDKIDAYYEANMYKSYGEHKMLNNKSFTDLSHIIQELKAIKPSDDTYDQAQAEIKILQNLVPTLDKTIKTGVLKEKNEIIDKAAETYQAQLYRENKDNILAKMGAEVMEREDTKEKAEIDGGVDMMLENYNKDLEKFQTAISSLASDAAKDGVSVEFAVDNFKVNGEDTEKVDFYAKKFSTLNNAITTTIDDYSKTQENYVTKLNDWQNNYQDVLALQDQSSREHSLFKINSSKFEDGFRSMAYSALSIVDEEKAVAKTKSMREGQEVGLEKPLDYRTAIETNQKWRFATGEMSTQGANMIVAIASGGVGTSMGLGFTGTSMLTGFGVFGTYSGTQKGIDIEIQRQAGEEAKKRLVDLDKNKFMYTPQDYMRTKMQLEEAIAYGDVSDSDKAKSMLATFAIEGTITSFLGTVPNSLKLIKKFKNPGLDISSKLLRSDLKAAGDVVWQTTKMGLYEIVEEVSIEGLTVVSDGLILGRDMNFDHLDDVAVTSIISSGGMTTLPNT